MLALLWYMQTLLVTETEIGGAYHSSGTLGHVGVSMEAYVVLQCWFDGIQDSIRSRTAVAMKANSDLG